MSDYVLYVAAVLPLVGIILVATVVAFDAALEKRIARTENGKENARS